MFVSPSKGKLELHEVIAEIVAYISHENRRGYCLMVGTDSQANTPPNPRGQANRVSSVDFVSAIVAHRIGRGGRYFWRRVHREYRQPLSLKARMFTEANLSIELALEMLAMLQQSFVAAFTEHQPKMEVHIDVGQNGPTREVIKELVGLVKASGFEARIKPESYVASTVADKYA